MFNKTICNHFFIVKSDNPNTWVSLSRAWLKPARFFGKPFIDHENNTFLIESGQKFIIFIPTYHIRDRI